MSFIFFNLLVNSILSLAFGLLLVYFFIWFFHVQTGGWKVFMLSLPFVKIVYDFVRGVPEQSILFSGVDPYSLPPRHQLLTVGAGLDGWAPYLSTVFSVNALDGKSYNSSIGDYLLIWVHRTFGSEVPLIIVTSVLTVSLVLLIIRFVQYYSFEKNRRKDRAHRTPYKTLTVDRRVVDIYISNNFSGTPFTGGILKPYICLPEEAIKKLRNEELTAVIAHELGHVRNYDLLGTILIQVLGDLFWFVPGYRWLSRKIDRLREVVADSWAVSTSVDPEFLALALLKLKEIPKSTSGVVLYSAFFREKSLLKERIERLIGNIKEKKPRFGWQYKWMRYGFILFISVVILNSVFGGNFKKEIVIQSQEQKKDVLNVSCVCISQKFYVQT